MLCTHWQTFCLPPIAAFLKYHNPFPNGVLFTQPPNGLTWSFLNSTEKLNHFSTTLQWFIHTAKKWTPVGIVRLQKAAKPVWAKQLTQLPCLVAYAKFQFVYITKKLIGQSAFAGFHQFSRPAMMGIWKGNQWVPRGKQRLPHSPLSPTCYLL